jgi:hypothetical protein
MWQVKIVVEYDNKLVFLLLLQVYFYLNLVRTLVKPRNGEDDGTLFG